MKKLLSLFFILNCPLITAMNSQEGPNPDEIIDLLEITKENTHIDSMSSRYMQPTNVTVPCIGSYFEPVISAIRDRNYASIGTQKLNETEAIRKIGTYTITEKYEQANLEVKKLTSDIDKDEGDLFKIKTAARLLHNTNIPYNHCIIITSKPTKNLESFINYYNKNIGQLEIQEKKLFPQIELHIIYELANITNNFFPYIFNQTSDKKTIFIVQAKPSNKIELKPKNTETPNFTTIKSTMQQPQNKLTSFFTKNRILGAAIFVIPTMLFLYFYKTGSFESLLTSFNYSK